MNGVNSRVTVVILTHDRTFEVLRTVERMSRLPERPPIIVVDNASSDNVSALIRRRFPEVCVIRIHKNIGAAARNAGVQAAVTPYVAFCDDDMVWAPGSLACAGRMLDVHPGVAVVTARVLVGTDEREDEACTRMACSPLPSEGLPGRAVVGFLPGACVVRRYAFLQAGGYEPKLFIGGEAELLALDLSVRGWSLVYSERLTVHHYPSSLRDVSLARRLVLRNGLWTAWLRRSAAAAVRHSARALMNAVRDVNAREGFLDAFRGLSWALRHRRAVPARVEAMCAAAERALRNALPRVPSATRRGPLRPVAASTARVRALARE
jgi:GT2 family glycosyltransferase